MAILEIRDENLIQRLQALSQAESRPIESILQSLLDQFAPQSAPQTEDEQSKKRESLRAMAGMIDADVTDLSASVRETMTKYYQDRVEDVD